MDRYRVDITNEKAAKIRIGEDNAIASLIFSGKASVAYERLDNALPRTRARALAAQESIRALTRTFGNMRGESENHERQKFNSYLQKLSLNQAYAVFVQGDNFATLLYSGRNRFVSDDPSIKTLGDFCVSRLLAMKPEQQAAILKTPNAVAHMINKGYQDALREIVKDWSQEDRDAIFTDEVKKWIRGFARSHSQPQGLGLFDVPSWG